MLINKKALLRSIRVCLILAGISIVAGLLFITVTNLAAGSALIFAFVFLSGLLPFVFLVTSPSRISLSPIGWATRAAILFVCLAILAAVWTSSLVIGNVRWNSDSLAMPLAIFAGVSVCFGLYNLKALMREASRARDEY
jgi:hypothetical protein